MNVINMIGGSGGSSGLTPTIRVYAPSGSTLTCDGQTYTLGDTETYHDFSVSCEKVDLLPTGYTGLEYIESSGTQYIDTGMILKGADHHSITVKMLSSSTSGYAIMGTYGNCARLSWDSTVSALNGTNTSTSLGTIDTTSEHTIEMEGSSATVDGTSVTISYSDYTTPMSQVLFALRDNDSSGSIIRMNSFDLYEYSIKRDSSYIIRLIPCTNASSEVGMYDTVSKTFFGNSGTGDFTASTTTKEWTDYPTYTVTATLDGVTATSEVTVDKVGLFETEIEFYTIPTDGLYAEYLFDDGTFADTSGNSRAGSVGEATFVENDTGYALQKNTSTTSPSINSLPTGACSISCWIKYPSTISNNHVLFYLYKGYNASFFEAVMSDGYLHTGQSTDALKLEVAEAGAIRHLVISYDSSFNATVYINGVDISVTFSGKYSNSYTGNYILGSNTNSVKWGDGWIDCMRIYSRELTADDVKNLYANGKMR